MSTIERLYAQAEHQRVTQQLYYAGALTPAEAFELLQIDSAVRLIDVRTRAELDWVGRPLVGAGQYVAIEWLYYPGGDLNPDFIGQLKQAVMSPDTPLLFLCRSAVRSKLAATAATHAGFTQAFDLLEGFEGAKNSQGLRKTVEGWCYHNLPWISA